MARQDFWDNQAEAQKIVSELTRLKGLVAPQTALKRRVDDLNALFELAEESDNDESLAAELAAETTKLHSE